jgi:hypothetical protein
MAQLRNVQEINPVWPSIIMFLMMLIGKVRIRTFNIGEMPQAYDAGFQHGILNIKQVIKVSGAMLNAENGACYPLPFSTPISGESVSLVADRTSVFVNVGNCDRSKFRGTVTLTYEVL